MSTLTTDTSKRNQLEEEQESIRHFANNMQQILSDEKTSQAISNFLLDMSCMAMHMKAYSRLMKEGEKQ